MKGEHSFLITFSESEAALGSGLITGTSSSSDSLVFKVISQKPHERGSCVKNLLVYKMHRVAVMVQKLKQVMFPAPMSGASDYLIPRDLAPPSLDSESTFLQTHISCN